MRPRVFGFIALTAAALTATPALAGDPQGNRRGQQPRETMRFAGMDGNRDGRITRQEWRGSDRSFRVHDWNNDGVLSGDEVRPGARRPRVDDRDDRDFDRQRSREFRDWTEEAFVELDHNRDGRITRNEWHFDREAWVRADRDRDDALTRGEFLGDPDLDMDREDRFEDLDVNNDGRIERAEWHGSREGFDWLDRNNDSVLSRTEALGDERPEDARESDLFVSLDYNRDGRLAPSEWHWSRRSFLRQDVNRDGAVSREEFVEPATAAAATTGTMNEQVIDVSSTERWVDTGIDLRAGDRVTVRATGTIRLSTNGSDMAGPAGADRRALNAPMPDQPAGALIARVGAGSPIFIGESTAPRNVTTGGRLYLAVNDDHLPDNVGSYRVTISIDR